MKEQKRILTHEKLRRALEASMPEMPEETHRAYLHAVTHVRATVAEKRIPPGFHLSGTGRLLLAMVVLLALLTVGATAAIRLASVTDYPPPLGLTEEYMAHVIQLQEVYESDLLTFSVNDLVFDGATVQVAMNVEPKEGAQCFLNMRTEGVCDGKTYQIEVEGCSGGDFMSGMFLPDLNGDWGDEYAFDGLLSDEDFLIPPEGAAIEWTMTFDILKPVWTVEYLSNETYQQLLDVEEYDALAAYVTDNWRRQVITVTHGSLVEYTAYAEQALMDEGREIPYSNDRAERLLAVGGFERADQVCVRFKTVFEDGYEVTEAVGKRLSLADYDLVVDTLRLSFLRSTMSLHYEFHEEKTRTEIEQMADLPRRWALVVNDETDGEMNRGYAEFDVVRIGTGLAKDVLTVGFDFVPTVTPITSLTLVPLYGEYGAETLDWSQALTLTIPQ